MVEEVKHPIMLKLKRQGWKFLTNQDLTSDYVHDRRGGYAVIPRKTLKSDAELIAEYKWKGFAKVRIADAFGSDGTPMPNYRAIYAKGNPSRKASR